MQQLRIMQGALNWDDLAWMRDRWKGKLYVKGVMHADDAARAVDEIGAEGVVVSNHGGRHLARVQGTLDEIPDIEPRIGHRARPEERRVGQECVIARSSRGSPYIYKLKITSTQ